MFEVDIVSDPSMALFPNEPIWGPDLARLRMYDENLLKPAIIFAEKITLRSTREDLQALNKSKAFQVRRMPMRQVSTAAGISLRKDPEEIDRLGLKRSDLIPAEDALGFFEKASGEELVAFGKKHEVRIMTITNALVKVLRSRHEALSGGLLDKAVELGIVSSEGWTVEGHDPWSLAWSEEEDFWSDGAISVAEMLSQANGAIMLDSGASQSLGSVAKFSPAPTNDLPGLLAHGMLTKLPGLQEVPLDELIDIRDDLDDYITPFRAAMADMAQEITVSSGAESSLEVEIERRWTTSVAPALAEMRHKARSESYPRALLDAISGDTSSLIAATSSVALAAGSISVGVATLLPAAAAASYPFVRALSKRLASRDEMRRNRLYLMYRVKHR
ncbi:hypothetical protein [Isoptericola croceus]|uniref:hypothetical protein n=1 Tax=Isoptericola croceus TaxID=3031406 RepID=UPI0023F8AEE0|nr:hypothetical protein [Isoptericola croceus]